MTDLLVGEIRGFRVFYTEGDELHAYAVDYVWEPGENVATCDQVGKHDKKPKTAWTNDGNGGLKKVKTPESNNHGPIPSPKCGCGFWVFKTERHARQHFGDQLGQATGGPYGHFGGGAGELVMAQVRGWGRAIEGEDGWRVERARVDAIISADPNRYAGIISRYDILPVFPKDDPPPVQPPARPLRDLLADVEALIERYVVLTAQQRCAIALWVVHTWASPAADCSPYLSVTSAVPRSGKTRLVDVLRLVVARPWVAIQPSEAVVFRYVHATKPTLFLDEVDTMFHSRDERHEPIRALLNAGNRRGTSVPRVVKSTGGQMAVEHFDVFCPKLLAGIGSPPTTITDRSIGIKMLRKRPGDRTERFRAKVAETQASPIRQQLAMWSQSGAVGRLRDAEPKFPIGLNDRAEEGWEPLFGAADMAGGEWPDRARAAAVALADEVADEVPNEVQLLADIRAAFDSAGTDRVTSEQLLRSLVESSPWGAWWGDSVEQGKLKGPSAKLSGLLKNFDIKPKNQRFDNRVLKGYLRSDFTDAWTRNLPSEKSLQTQQSLQSTSGTMPLTSDVAVVADVATFSEKVVVEPEPQVPDPDFVLERITAHNGNLFAVATELNTMAYTQADGSWWTAAVLEAWLQLDANGGLPGMEGSVQSGDTVTPVTRITP